MPYTNLLIYFCKKKQEGDDADASGGRTGFLEHIVGRESSLYITECCLNCELSEGIYPFQFQNKSITLKKIFGEEEKQKTLSASKSEN